MNASVPVVSKLPDSGTSIFAVMTRLADEHGAINLSQGFPDFDCDPARDVTPYRPIKYCMTSSCLTGFRTSLERRPGV